jgi:hypothetical protein
MKGFIKLTEYVSGGEESPVYVNINQITRFVPITEESTYGSRVMGVSIHGFIEVIETPEEILQQIRNNIR